MLRLDLPLDFAAQCAASVAVARLAQPELPLWRRSGNNADRAWDEVRAAPAASVLVNRASNNRLPAPLVIAEPYLQLILFDGMGQIRAANHARFELVCRTWAVTAAAVAAASLDVLQQYEKSVWDLHFADKGAYQWTSEVVALVDQVTHFRTKAKQAVNPYEQVSFCLQSGEGLLILMFVLFWLGCFAGVIIVANYLDGGVLGYLEKWMLAVPFLAGGFFWLVSVSLVGLRLAWQSRQLCKQSARQAVVAAAVREVGELQLSKNAVAKLARTSGTFPPENCEFMVTVSSAEPKNNEVLKCDVIAVCHQPDAGHEEQEPEEQARYCIKAHRYALVLTTPMAGVSIAAVLACWAETTAVLACMPLVAVMVGVTVVLFVSFLRGIIETPWLVAVLSVQSLSLCAFFVTWPLALDGTIPNKSAADWGVALSPLALFSLVTTIGAPVTALVAIFMDDYNWWSARCHSLVVLLGVLCLAAAVVTFNMCLVGLCMKASGDWELMSYTGFATTILCSLTTYPLSFAMILFSAGHDQ